LKQTKWFFSNIYYMKIITPKTSIFQFLPHDLLPLCGHTKIKYHNANLKTAYLIDIIHHMILKYYFRDDNRFNISATIFKEKYGKIYNYYMEYLCDKGMIRLVKNYNCGKNSKVYALADYIIDGKITRYYNTDTVLLKKHNKRMAAYESSYDDGLIDRDVRIKLIENLYSVNIDVEAAMYYLNNIVHSVDAYNKNVYSVESIKNLHIFYHFDGYGRMHTNFTILKSHIRKNYLQIDGQELMELDINNSQPLFLTKIIDETILNGVDDDEFRLFKYLTQTGNLYQYIIDNSKKSAKSEVKKLTYKVLFGKNYPNMNDAIFNYLFPTIHQFIKNYKYRHKNHKILSHQLQKLESNLIYNVIIKEVMAINPDIKFVTIHDSILFPKKYEAIVSKVFNDNIKKEFDI